MKDSPTSDKSQFSQFEEEMLEVWEKEGTFEKSVKNRQGQPAFVYNDGPPFANGLPHFGHSLVTSIKDSMLRYKTMRGYYTPRRNGWDCHGLPVEYSIEKKFGVSGKKQITELGLDKFNAACRASIFHYKAEWETFYQRFGRWSDYEHYYATVDTNYTESVWWVLSQIQKKGLLYRGLKAVPYCPRCETPLSNFELNEGYQDNVPDPSVYVLFPLKSPSSHQINDLSAAQDADTDQVYLVAWTTTPWTLPANAALAVDKDADYVYLKLKSANYTVVIAKDRLEALKLILEDYKLLKTVKGAELVGLRYEPAFKLKDPSAYSDEQLNNGWRIFHDDNVSLEEGSGIVQTATPYGDPDLALIQRQNLPLIYSVDASGRLTSVAEGLDEVTGRFFKDADEHIIAVLAQRGRILAAETFKHTYPFCWRCETPLMYFATTSWFLAVTKVKDQLLKTAEEINWVPAHIKTGRFGKWLEGARDWAISRNRYWGAPMPIWVNQADPDDYIVVGSLAELKELTGGELDLPTLEDGLPDLHRPFIDDIVIKKDGKTYKRVEEVLDCWFESGSSPLAQWHYPFENQEVFEHSFPADFVTEGLDQTRLWFYVQHVICTILFDRPAFKNVVVNGIILAADGQKLSKRLRNYPPIEDVFDHEGVDSLRLYLLSSTQATETADYPRFKREAVTDSQRNVLARLLNSFRFFKTYTDIDKWQPRNVTPMAGGNILDQWILARLHETIRLSTGSLDNYKIAHGVLPVIEFIDDLSNWYIRRSRRRFWKSQNDADKENAYATLHCCLIKTCQLLAPWSPFISDYLWRQLTGDMELPNSVHLSDWPSVKEPDNASTELLGKMAETRRLIAEGLAQRATAGIKVRQPLAQVTLHVSERWDSGFDDIIRDELNVKGINWQLGLSDSANVADAIEVETNLTPELKAEGIARELIRLIQNARKKAGFNVEDRINLHVESPNSEITGALKQWKDTIFEETLATGELSEAQESEYAETVKVEGQEVTIKLSRQG